MVTAVNDNDPEFSQDLLRGAAEIAEFLFGNRELRRRVYHLAATSNLTVFFKLGSTLCARRSTLKRWITEQESRRKNDNRKHP
jgi:hypothetical protein